MKVILLEDIKGVGKKDQVINASDGYATNFLFPKKLALEATQINIQRLDAQKKREEEEKKELLLAAGELKTKLEQVTVIIEAKAGASGKLFGAITNKEVSEKLNAQNFEIDRKKIELKDIKNIGEYDAVIKLHPKVLASIKVKVINGS